VLALGVVLAAVAAIMLLRGRRTGDRGTLPAERGDMALGATSVRWVGVLVLIALIGVVSIQSIGSAVPGTP
jgi:hypothetical protein